MGIEESYLNCIEKVFNKIISAIFQTLRKEMSIEIQEALSRISILYHIIVETLGIHNKESIERTAGEKYQIMHEERPIRMREPTKTLKGSRAFQGLNYQNHLPDCYTRQNTHHNWKGKKTVHDEKD